MTYQGIIFDLDGVLCYTDRLHYLAWKGIADELGIFFDETVNHRLRGVSRRESFNIILESYDKELTEAEIEECLRKKNEHYVQLLATLGDEDLAEGAFETLAALRAMGIKLAVGSSSRNAPTILRRLGLTPYFDAVSDGNNITKSKPDPEVFVMAAEFLDLQPARCLVVEDAVAGLIAAREANMDSAAIGDEAVGSGLATHALGTLTDLIDLCK